MFETIDQNLYKMFHQKHYSNLSLHSTTRYTRPPAWNWGFWDFRNPPATVDHSPHSTTVLAISLFRDLVLDLKEKPLKMFVSDVQNPQNFHLRRCFAFTFRPNMYTFRLNKIWVILPCDYAYTSWFLRFHKSIRHTRPLATLDHLGSKFRLSLHSTGRV